MWMLGMLLCAWLLADIFAGIFHWVQDQYLDGNSRFSFINSVSADNDLHHDKPMAFTKFTYWENINTSVAVACPAALLVWVMDGPLVLALAVLFAQYANIIHRWGHLPIGQLNWFILGMQSTGLFISRSHHHRHHFKNGKVILKQDTTLRYCPMTNWMNPILDTLKVFTILEVLLSLIGIKTTKMKVYWKDL